jgi:long-chain acyl-CoA synthetase
MNEPVWEKAYPRGITWHQQFAPKSLPTLFDEAARKWSDRPMIDFMGKRYRYRDIADLVDRAAKGFQQLGVGPGVHVGLFLPNTPHYPIAFFGVLKAGGRVVNYSPLDAERELKHKIEDSRTEIMVTLGLKALYPQMGKMLGATPLKKLVVGGLPEVLPFPKNALYPLAKKKDIAEVPRDDRHLRFKDLIANDGRYAAHEIRDPAEEIALLQYTGGTTGVPKGAMLSHANLTAAVQMYQLWTGGDEPVLREGEERILAVLPMFHIYALTVILLNGMNSGSEMILHPRFELHAVLEDLHKKKPTVFPGVPTMYMAIASHPKIKDYDLSSLKYCGSGGAPLPPEVQAKFEALTGCRLREGWGMTETAPAGTASPISKPAKAGSCGVPLPGIIIEVVDIDDPLKVLPVGQKGEICIRGPNVMKGYWNKPEATAEAFAGGRFHTGDIGYIDEDGFVFLVDRKKDMILSGGFNVYPRTIEDAIYEHPDVEEVTVIGIPDDYRGQSAKAFIKLRAGARPFTLDELKDFLKDKLGKHELPADMEIREALPKTPIGKLSKKELVEEERRKYEAHKAQTAAQ